MTRSCKVAVIGAGVSGLVAAWELLREAHNVTVFEKSNRVGGVWVYDPNTESDQIGLDPARRKVHCSLYASLRTNLPRPMMGFTDYPLTGRVFGDAREFPGHEEVLRFLEAFAQDYGLRMSLNWFRRSSMSEDVMKVEIGGWSNGEKGRSRWLMALRLWWFVTGIISTRWYRKFQVVVVIGMGPSGFDISEEIAYAAKEVHIALRNSVFSVGKIPGLDNIFEHELVRTELELVTHVQPDEQVCFADGFSVIADVILYCTGYKYQFPFLETDDITVDDNRVGPLYKHVFSPKHGPRLSFVGITYVTIVFLTLERQSKWIAYVLSGKCTLPSENEMMASVKEMYDEMKETDKPRHRTHWLYPMRIEYLEWLATEIGLPWIEKWWFEMFEAVLKGAISIGHGYREKWGEISYS